MRKRLHKGFLIVDAMLGGEFKAYRSLSYYMIDVPTFTAMSAPDIDSRIDEAEWYGDFTLEQFNEVASATDQPLQPDITNEQYQALSGLGKYVIVSAVSDDGSFIVRTLAPYYRIHTSGVVEPTGQEG